MLQMKADSVPAPCHQGRELCAGFCLFSIVLGELQPKVDQKEQNKHGDYLLDVLDVNNIEKFKINPYKYSYNVCM